MKKYKIMMLTVMVSINTLGIQGQQAPRVANQSSIVAMRLKQLVVPANDSWSRNLVLQFNAAVISLDERLSIAKRIINSFSSRKASQHKITGKLLNDELNKIICEPNFQIIERMRTQLNTAKAENDGLKKRLVEAQKKVSPEGAPSVQKIKELEEKIIEVQKKEREQVALVAKMTAENPKLPKLLNLKERAEVEFGKEVVKKMIAKNELALSDFIDENARFLSIMGLHVKDGRLTSRTMEGGEETTPEWELAQAKLSIAQLMEENESHKKQIAKCKQKREETGKVESLSGEKKQNEELKQLLAENKELKKQIKESPRDVIAEQSEISSDAALKKELEDAQEEIKAAVDDKQQFIERIERIHSALSGLFGDKFADAVTNNSTQDLLSKIDYTKSFVKELGAQLQSAGWFGF